MEHIPSLALRPSLLLMFPSPCSKPDVGPGSLLQFQVQCWAQGHRNRVPMSAPRLLLFTQGEVEGHFLCPVPGQIWA